MNAESKSSTDLEALSLLGELVIGVTGHRPQALGGYGPEAHQRRVSFAREIIGEHRPARVITGMAQGWDQAVALACIDLGIPFTTAVPFEGQEKIWPAASQREYRHLLSRAAEIVIVTANTAHQVRDMMNWRNHWIVDHCDLLLALYHKGQHGGTQNCVIYAQQKRRPTLNVWDRWQASVA